ncbi:MAG: NAD(+) diphosphatase [Frankiaceae bacterium]
MPALSRSGVDRAAHRRVDEAYLARAWADPGSRAFLVHDGQALIDFPDVGPILRLQAPQRLPQGERLFLGEAGGTAYFAVLAPLPDVPSGGNVAPLGLRDVGALLSDVHAGLFTHAVALANWHASHRCCPRCGGSTHSASGGSIRRCAVDGSEHFPRVDPAVIMLVHDGGDRVVLGRAPSWPSGRFSILAGFVEPGESLEHAVAREVAEEVGLTVTDIRYVGSQPWPLPSSLMLGFTARAAYEPLRPDPAELAEAYWYTRREVRDGKAGTPSPVSIAHWLLHRWLDTGLAVPRVEER